MAVVSSTSPLTGAREVNMIHMATAYQDLGGKLAFAISALNALVSSVSTLNVAVSAINAALVSAANSGVTLSAFSAAPTSTLLLGSYTGSFSNFSA